MSNYPPGVSGNEYAIAGGTARTATRTVEHECDAPYEEDFNGEVTVDGEYYDFEFWGTYECPQCGQTVDYEETIDPDDYYDG